MKGLLLVLKLHLEEMLGVGEWVLSYTGYCVPLPSFTNFKLQLDFEFFVQGMQYSL